jgi:hypothetical protein
MNIQKKKFWLSTLLLSIIVISIYGFLSLVQLNTKYQHEKASHRQPEVQQQDDNHILLKAAVLYYFLSQ